jgi:hypothetical protein
MKVTIGYAVLIVVILVVIFFSLSSAAAFVPYSPSTLFSKEYKYEGFKGGEYTTYPANASIDSYTSRDIKDTTSGQACKRVWGFDGLLCNPSSSDASIDTFSKASSSTTCASSGLTNSTGFLCLDANQSKLMSSRGGNATGRDSQIGN